MITVDQIIRNINSNEEVYDQIYRNIKSNHDQVEDNKQQYDCDFSFFPQWSYLEVKQLVEALGRCNDLRQAWANNLQQTKTFPETLLFYEAILPYLSSKDGKDELLNLFNDVEAAKATNRQHQVKKESLIDPLMSTPDDADNQEMVMVKDDEDDESQPTAITTIEDTTTQNVFQILLLCQNYVISKSGELTTPS